MGLFGTKNGSSKMARRCAERRLLNRGCRLPSGLSNSYIGTPLELTIRDPGPSVNTWNDQVTLWDSSIQHGRIGLSGVVSAAWPF
jgi:hypothetical protein